VTPSGVNFINVLQAAFTLADPESAKKTVKSSSFFALSGSAGVKAARIMLMKLTPGFHLEMKNFPNNGMHRQNLNSPLSSDISTNCKLDH